MTSPIGPSQTFLILISKSVVKALFTLFIFVSFFVFASLVKQGGAARAHFEMSVAAEATTNQSPHSTDDCTREPCGASECALHSCFCNMPFICDLGSAQLAFAKQVTFGTLSCKRPEDPDLQRVKRPPITLA